MKDKTSEIKKVLAECPLAKAEDIRPSEDGGTPCEICAYIGEMTKVLQEAEGPLEKIHRELQEIKKPVKKLREKLNELERCHPRCASCGIYFGGVHITEPFKFIPELSGSVCEDCAKQIKAKKFKGEDD